ncbi:unnamed protein product [Phaeothamnion confervicola]
MADDGAAAAVEDRIVMLKRPAAGDEDGAGTKRVRLETAATLALVEHEGIERTSTLLAPTMQLSGHEAPVYSVEFDPTGQSLASASFDRTIFLWNVFGECENYNVLRGHKNAVLQLHWASDGQHIVSVSADKTVAWWDAHAGVRKKTFKGHRGVVNGCAVSSGPSPALFSASDDCTAQQWDPRARRSVQAFAHDFQQVTAVAASPDGVRLFTGGVDDIVREWDVRRPNDVILQLEGHMDTVTGLALNPAGTHVLSNAMDRTMREWDVRPFASGDRCEKVFHGLQHGAEKNLLRCSWSPSGLMTAGGSSDRAVHIFDEPSAQELYFLPGHAGSVNDVVFHPSEPIIASCSSDKQIFLGEL